MRTPTPVSACITTVVTGAATLALATVLALAVAATLLTGGVANAQIPVGTLTADPATSTDLRAPVVRTSGPCPAPSDAYNIRLTGPGQLDFVVGNSPNVSTTAPFDAPFEQTFRDAAALNTPLTTIQNGTYTATLNCVVGFEDVRASFVVDFVFTVPATGDPTYVANNPTPTTTDPPVTTTVPPAMTTDPPAMTTDPPATTTVPPATTTDPPATTTVPETTTTVPETTTTPSTTTIPPATTTPAPQPGPRTTTTTLSVFPRPAFAGFPVVFIARVSPFAAAGAIQLKDGDTNIGGPVQVFGGIVFGITTGVTSGTHSLTAVFTPNNPARFGPSTSPAVDLRVRSIFSLPFFF